MTTGTMPDLTFSDVQPPAAGQVDSPTALPPTLIVALIDESGSMEKQKADVVGGYKQFVLDQRKVQGAARIAVVKFNTRVHTVMVPADIHVALETLLYTPGGGTALLDALAAGIKVADQHKAAGERVLFLVITDGEENASHETTKDQVMSLIKDREGRGDWTFTYLGVEPDKWHEIGGHLGNAAAAGPIMSANFATVSEATRNYRVSPAAASRNFYQK